MKSMRVLAFFVFFSAVQQAWPRRVRRQRSQRHNQPTSREGKEEKAYQFLPPILSHLLLHVLVFSFDFHLFFSHTHISVYILPAWRFYLLAQCRPLKTLSAVSQTPISSSSGTPCPSALFSHEVPNSGVRPTIDWICKGQPRTELAITCKCNGTRIPRKRKQACRVPFPPWPFVSLQRMPALTLSRPPFWTVCGMKVPKGQRGRFPRMRFRLLQPLLPVPRNTRRVDTFSIND